MNRRVILSWSLCVDGKPKYRLVEIIHDERSLSEIKLEERETDAMNQDSWRFILPEDGGIELFRKLGQDISKNRLRIVEVEHE